MRLRRSRPAIVPSTIWPPSSSIENIPARNFSTTFPITSIPSSFPESTGFVARFVGCISNASLVAVAAASSSAATAVSATAITTATAARALGFRTSFIHGQRASVQLPSAEGCDGALAFLVIAHFDESKAALLAGVAVGDDAHAIYGAEFLEQSSYRVLGGVKT